MVYGTYNYSIHGVFKPTNITGGAHIVCYGCIYIRKWRAKAAKELQYELSFPHSRADKQS